MNAGANVLHFPGQPNRSAMRFASGSDEVGSPRFAPPPGGAGDGNDDEGPAPSGPWRSRASFRGANAEARFEVLRQMRSGVEIEQSVTVDLAELSSATDAREAQLDYLRGVMESMDLYSRSGMTIAPSDAVRAVHLIASAASDLADFISLKKVEHTPLAKRVSSMMGRIVSCADHLERWTIAAGTMDRTTAEHLAHIYYSAAVKGAGGDAVRHRRASGQGSPVHVANVLLRLLDAQERFARLGKTKEAREAMKSVTTLFVHHDVPTKGKQWAIGVAADHLKDNVDRMYAAEGKRREELHGEFLRNVGFFTYGNRQFAPAILFHCEEALAEESDAPMHRRFREWAKDEMRLSNALARI